MKLSQIEKKEYVLENQGHCFSEYAEGMIGETLA